MYFATEHFRETRTELSRKDAVSETAVGRSFDEIKEYRETIEKYRDAADEVEQAWQERPVEVRLTPSADGKYLVAENHDVKWQVADDELGNETAVDFFTEYGFEQEANSITTVMVRDKSNVKRGAPVLEDTKRDWYLLPNTECLSEI